MSAKLPELISRKLSALWTLQAELNSDDRQKLFDLCSKYLTAYLSWFVSKHIPAVHIVHTKHIIARELHLIHQALPGQADFLRWLVDDLGSGKFFLTWLILPDSTAYTIHFSVCSGIELETLFSKLSVNYPP